MTGTQNPFSHRAAEQIGGIVDVIECESLEFISDEEEYKSRLSMLISRGKLIQMTDNDKQKIASGDWKRVGGDVICHICEKNYYSHPRLHKYAILNKLCDGSLVKL